MEVSSENPPEEIILELLENGGKIFNIEQLEQELAANGYTNVSLFSMLDNLECSGKVRLFYKEQKEGSPLVKYIGT